MRDLVITPGLPAPNVTDGFLMDAVALGKKARWFGTSADRSCEVHADPDVTSPSHILGIGYRFQVGWINTALDPAEMIELKSFGDRANELLIRDDMGERSSSARESNLSVVGIGRVSALPDPTEGFVSAILDDEVLCGDRPTPIPPKRAAIITEPRPARARRKTTNLAVEYLYHRVTSLVEVARKGLAEWVSASPSFYLDATLKEVT